MSEQQATTSLHNGFGVVVKGTTVEMRNAGAGVVAAQGDISIQQGGAQLMLAGGDLSVREGGAQSIIARGDVSIQEGGALVVAAANVEFREGLVGVALGRDVKIDNSRVLFPPAAAFCLGAGFGVALAVARRFLGR